MSQPFIGPYKDNFPIITDVGLKIQLNKIKQLKNTTNVIPIIMSRT